MSLIVARLFPVPVCQLGIGGKAAEPKFARIEMTAAISVAGSKTESNRYDERSDFSTATG